MKYKIRSEAEKNTAVQYALKSGKSIRQVSLEMGIAFSSLKNWIHKERMKTDSEYAKLMKERESKKLRAEDPFPDGVLMAAKTNPEELARENKDLRRKIAYQEDKIAYLETLYKLIGADPDKIDKKKESRPSGYSSKEEGKT